MKKSALSVLLITAALLSACMTACGETEPAPTPAESEKSTPPAQTETEAVTEEQRLPSGLPDTDLGGFVLTMFQASDFFHEDGLYAKETTGDSVNDAVYNRNAAIMEKYNCTLEEQTSDDKYVMKTLKTFILAGDDTVDVIYECGGSVKGDTQYFLDIAELPYIDFSKPWWSEEFNEGITLDGHLFFTIGAHMITTRSTMIGTIFNKDVARNYDIDIPGLYDAARNGKWTLDMMGEYAKMATHDLNGDGVIDEQDQWGMLGENYDNWSLALGSGFRCVTKDDSGAFLYNFGCEKNMQIMDKVMKYTADKNTCIFAQQMTTEDVWTTLDTMITNGQFLFTFNSLGNKMRDYKYDFGFLPIPKFDEAQPRYYHDGSLGNSRVMVVPKTTTDPDTAAFLIEALAYNSYYDLLPVYYQNYLNTKVLRDEDSVEMLQLIENSIYYDCGALYNWGDMRTIIEDFVAADGNTLASTAASKEKAVLKGIENTLKAVRENE